MKNKKIIFILLIFIGVIVTYVLENISGDMDKSENKRIHQHMTTSISDNYPYESSIDDKNFVSHLPVVVLDTKGQKILSKRDSEDPEINIDIKVVDNESGNNHVYDRGNLVTKSKIRYRGNSSLSYDKKQYSLKFINDDGTENKQELMGMSASDEWVLNGTFLDKSMIRNYIGYNIAGEIMDYAPNIRFCEVFIFDGEKYTYQGLYTMIESIDRATQRVNISKYDESRAQTSYIVRRDRFSDEEVMLYNYGTQEELTEEWLGVKYPSSAKLTKKSYKFIEDDISRIEKVLYSDDYETFMTYPEYIDVDSFVDYYVVNEFFANYDAGLHSTYAYKDLGGKLKMGPVWDFDGAMDNAVSWALNPNATAFQTSSWYEALIKDDNFCKKVDARYTQLRKTILSDKYIDEYIDGVVDYVWPAIQRDEELWGYIFDKKFLVNEENDLGFTTNRNAENYSDEIQRLKLTIHTHAKYLDTNFYSDISSNIIYEPESLNIMKYMAVFFVLGFFVLIIIVRHE